MAWAGEELVGFGSAFDDSGLGAVGAVGEEVSGDEAEDMASEGGRAARAMGVEEPGGLLEEVDGSFEAEGVCGAVVRGSGLEKQGTDEVVGDEVHGQLAPDHGGALAAQSVHAHGGLDVSEVEFDLPALTEELGERLGWETLGIEECGDEADVTGAEARDGNSEAELAQAQLARQALEEVFGQGGSGLRGSLPDDEMVVASEAFGGLGGLRSPLMEAKDHVHSALGELGDGGEGTEGAVCEHHVSGPEEAPEAAEQAAVVNAERTSHGGQGRAGSQAEQSAHPHDGEAAAGLLPGGLRPEALVGWGIRHRDAGGVHHANATPHPAVVGPHESFKPQGDLAGNPQQPRIRQASPRLAVGAGGGAGRRLAQRQAKGLDLLERVAAGKRRSHDLEEEPPEGHHRRIGALALRRGKTLQFQQRAEGPKQLFEGALAEAAGRPAQPTGEWDWRHARYYQYTYL